MGGGEKCGNLIPNGKKRGLDIHVDAIKENYPQQCGSIHTPLMEITSSQIIKISVLIPIKHYNPEC